jgi:hypothetical protein
MMVCRSDIRGGWLLAVLFVALLTPACAAVEGIFKAGFTVGILAAVVVVGLILWFAMGRRGV